MEFTSGQIKELCVMLTSTGMSLADLLKNFFSGVDISIIQGYDNFSYEPYIKDAFFRKELAEEEEERLSLKGTGDLSDSYRVVTEMIGELEIGGIEHWKTGYPLDSIHKKMVYENLLTKLSSKGKKSVLDYTPNPEEFVENNLPERLRNSDEK